jgi:hypothetical protein
MSSLSVIFGTIIYAFIKITGYSLFAKYLNSLFSKHENVWKVGLVRTVLGILLGLIHNGIFFSFFNISMGRSPIGGEGTYLFFILLVLLRVIEWGLIVHWFYNKKLTKRTKVFKAVGLGIIWSFVLDIPLMFGLFVAIASIC